MKNQEGGREICTFRLDSERKEYLREEFDSISGRCEFIVENWIETEEELGVREDIEQTQLAVLRAYRNAIAKNIQTLEYQKDKLDRQIEDFESDEDEEILMEIKLDFVPQSI